MFVAAEEFGEGICMGGGGGGGADGLAIGFGAFADGEDGRVGGLQVGVGEDAFVAIEAGGAGEFHVGCGAGGDEEEIAGEGIFEARGIGDTGLILGDAGGGDLFGAGEFDEIGVEENLDAAVGEFFGEVR